MTDTRQKIIEKMTCYNFHWFYGYHQRFNILLQILLCVRYFLVAIIVLFMYVSRQTVTTSFSSLC